MYKDRVALSLHLESCSMYCSMYFGPEALHAIKLLLLLVVVLRLALLQTKNLGPGLALPIGTLVTGEQHPQRQG